MIKIANLIFVLVTGVMGCNSDAPKTETIQFTQPDTSSVHDANPKEKWDHVFAYQLNKPDETFNMPESLLEISGLGISDSGKNLYAVQDEKGTIFKISKKNGDVIEKIKFHKEGDYEGIEVVGDQIYVVKSTGTIYQVINPGQSTQQMKKYNSFLSRENDVEGLTYDKKNHRLLLACKGIPATGESFEVVRYKKVVYSFDLATHTLNPDPVYTIQLREIRNYLEQHTHLKEYEKLVEFFSAGKENLTFNPSAIAIHPITGEIYITSSRGKVLIVLNEAGVVTHIEKLSKKVHAQPEGLVFDRDGTLYISNEGKGGKPKIHRFRYKKG